MGALFLARDILDCWYTRAPPFNVVSAAPAASPKGEAPQNVSITAPSVILGQERMEKIFPLTIGIMYTNLLHTKHAPRLI
jgi:hypothetical protein